jgi:signal transduction histidine kinase
MMQNAIVALRSMSDTPAASLVELVDSVEVFVYGLTPEGRIMFANQRGVEISRLPRDAVVGADWRSLFSSHEQAEQLASLWAAVTPGCRSQPFEALCPTGRRLRWHFTRWHLRGEPGICAVGTDVTDERDERSRSKASEWVTTLANLGSGLAHELRNPLNGANLQLMLLSKKLAKLGELGVELAAQVDAATFEIRRTAAFLDDFLAFACPRTHSPQRVELGSVIDRAIERVLPRATENGVRICVAPIPPTVVEICTARIEDAIHNLAANAIDASRDGQEPAVSVRSQVAGDVVVIEIEDNGPGVAPDAPVFEPFYTTKPNGTGLGLAIVNCAALEHGGTVEFKRQGNATVFSLKLPLTAGILKG